MQLWWDHLPSPEVIDRGGADPGLANCAYCAEGVRGSTWHLLAECQHPPTGQGGPRDYAVAHMEHEADFGLVADEGSTAHWEEGPETQGEQKGSDSDD